MTTPTPLTILGRITRALASATFAATYADNPQPWLIAGAVFFGLLTLIRDL